MKENEWLDNSNSYRFSTGHTTFHSCIFPVITISVPPAIVWTWCYVHLLSTAVHLVEPDWAWSLSKVSLTESGCRPIVQRREREKRINSSVEAFNKYLKHVPQVTPASSLCWQFSWPQGGWEHKAISDSVPSQAKSSNHIGPDACPKYALIRGVALLLSESKYLNFHDLFHICKLQQNSPFVGTYQGISPVLLLGETKVPRENAENQAGDHKPCHEPILVIEPWLYWCETREFTHQWANWPLKKAKWKKNPKPWSFF